MGTCCSKPGAAGVIDSSIAAQQAQGLGADNGGKVRPMLVSHIQRSGLCVWNTIH